MVAAVHDPVCKGCSNIPTCKTPCPPVQWIDGNHARREPLLRDMSADHDHNPIAARDYKTVLADALRARTGRIEDIRQIGDVRIRAVAALAYAGISRRDISRLLGVSGAGLKKLVGRHVP